MAKRASTKTGETNLRPPHNDDANHPASSSDDHPQHYNPGQPRVPAGHQGGGQWTRGDFGHNEPIRLAFDERTEPLRRIDSPPLAPTEPRSPVPRRRFPVKLSVWGAIATAIGALLRQKDPDQQPALVFKVNDNWRDSQGTWQFKSLKNLTQDDVNAICGDQIKDLQRLLDDAVETAVSKGKNLAPGPFGTLAHQLTEEEVKKKIEELKALGVKTEFLIARDENGKLKIMDKKGNPKGSLRLDLGDFNGTDTVCITDYKFGEKGLEKAQIEKILQAIKELFRDVTRILITEAKPTWSPLFKPKQQR